MLDILEEYCQLRQFKVARIDGQTKGNDRQEAIDAFSSSNSDYFIFLLSTRAGGLGINAVAVAKDMGAEQIIAFDQIPGRLELARAFGADHALSLSDLPTPEERIQAVMDLTGGFGADVTIDAVGHPAVFEQAFYSRDLAGRVVLVGVPRPDMQITLPLLEVFGRGGALKSSWYGDCLPSRDFPMLVDLYRQGRFPLADFVSETVGLDDVEKAFEKMHAGEVLRSVVVF